MTAIKTWKILPVVLISWLIAQAVLAQPKIEFWNQQRKGANGDGGRDPETWFRAAADVGIEYVRLIPESWPSQGRDFLLGNADHFTGIPAADLRKLKAVLDVAHRHHVKILLTMFSLPGARNRQSNDYAFDYRLWTDEKYQQQSLNFWKELAAFLQNHPAIIGYNPLNEPHPARRDGFTDDQDTVGWTKWLAQHEGAPSDLNRFNRRIVKAIRSQDPHTPIVLDCCFHSGPNGIRYLRPVDDPAVLYAFHFYEPWIFATYRVNKDRFAYPDKMPTGQGDATRPWTPAELHQRVRPVVEWAQRFSIPPLRIVAEEFGCDRRVVGAQNYLVDSIAVFNQHQWHWAFYSFRGADWDGLDYELGTEKLGWKYWQQREKGIDHEDLINRHDNPLWDVFKRELAPNVRTVQVDALIVDPHVREQVEAFSSNEWREREQAAQALAAIGPKAYAVVPHLIKRLADEQWHVRKAAAIALSCMGPVAEPAVPALIIALGDEEWHVRKPAAQALAAIGPASAPAVPALITALTDEEWHVRRPAAQALAAIGTEAYPAVAQLTEALVDWEWQVRSPAALALAAIGTPARPALDRLIAALDDEEWKVRKHAAQALGAIGILTKPVLTALRQAVNDEEDPVRSAAAAALKKIDDLSKQTD